MQIANDKRITHLCQGKNIIFYNIEGISEDFRNLYLKRVDYHQGMEYLYSLDLRGKLCYNSLRRVPNYLIEQDEILAERMKEYQQTFGQFKNEAEFNKWCRGKFHVKRTLTFIDDRVVSNKIVSFIRKATPLMSQDLIDFLATVLPQDANLDEVTKGLNRRLSSKLNVKFMRDYLDNDRLVVIIDKAEMNLFDFIVHQLKF